MSSRRRPPHRLYDDANGIITVLRYIPKQSSNISSLDAENKAEETYARAPARPNKTEIAKVTTVDAQVLEFERHFAERAQHLMSTICYYDVADRRWAKMLFERHGPVASRQQARRWFRARRTHRQPPALVMVCRPADVLTAT